MHLAEAVKRVVTVPVIAVGRINLKLGEEIITEGKADLVAMGRGLLADPDLPMKAAEGRFEDIRPCLSCRICGDIFIHIRRSAIRCQVNAMLGRGREYEPEPAERRKRVLVIGGGPAGMEAARVAALRGHEVILCEREPKLGGQMLLAAVPPHKTTIQDFTDYLATQLDKLGVKVKLGIEVTPDLVGAIKPDVVILATGVTPLIPKIPGIDDRRVATAEDVLKGKTEVGINVIVVGGGMVGCEVSDYLSENGRKVTVLEMLPELARDMGISMRTRLLSRLAAKGVTLLTGAQCSEITEQGVVFMDKQGQVHVLKADTVVLATGSRPNRELCQMIGSLVPETYLIGDCVAPNRILEAVSDGFRVARMI